jgi:methylmalonyl-CoA mutase
MFATPAEVARQAIENDVHCVGVSSQAAGSWHTQGAAKSWWWAASSPAEGRSRARAAGVAAVFGPGTAIPEAAREVLRQIRARSG